MSVNHNRPVLPAAFRAPLSRRDLLVRGGKLGAGLLVAGPLLSACSSDNSTSPQASTSGTPAGGKPVAGGTLHAALTGEPDSLDPAVSAIYTGAQVYDNIFSKLVDIDPDGKFFGVLAKKWTQQDDKTWVFDLIDGATFHNGEKFTGNDVAYTFTRILDPKTASAYASLYDTIDRVEVVNPARVVFHLKSPFGPFLSNLANNGEIVNQKAIESADPARNPVGTGPFQFVEWAQGDHITLKKFPDYFETGKPYLDQIDFRFLLVDQSRKVRLHGEHRQQDDQPSHRYREPPVRRRLGGGPHRNRRRASRHRLGPRRVGRHRSWRRPIAPVVVHLQRIW